MVLPTVLAVALLAGSAPAGAAAKPDPFIPPNWPLNIAPVDWPDKPGTRYEMDVLVQKVPPSDIIINVNAPAWTRQDWEKDRLGTYRVGDRVYFDVVIGDRNSRYFGSVKDGRDGGKFRGVVRWMDPSGQKVLREDDQAVRFACATCAGFYSLYFNVPSYAVTGKQRLRLSYVNEKLKLDLSRELTFDAVNDGSWDDPSVIRGARSQFPGVFVLQQGLPCRELGMTSYQGTADTYLLARHDVPDRRADHCNFGGLAFLDVGQYGLDNRALLRFDLSAIPSRAEVAAAWLQLYLSAWPGERHGQRVRLQAFEVLKPWKPGRGNGDIYSKEPVAKGEASWQCHAYPDKWDAPGCDAAGKDRSAEPIGSAEDVTKAKAWATVPLKAEVVARWIRQPEAYRGLLLVGEGSRATFHSSEFEDPAMRPRLVVALSSPLPHPSTATSQSGASEATSPG